MVTPLPTAIRSNYVDMEIPLMQERKDTQAGSPVPRFLWTVSRCDGRGGSGRTFGKKLC